MIIIDIFICVNLLVIISFIINVNNISKIDEEIVTIPVIFKALILSFMIGLLSNALVYIFTEDLLMLIFNTTSGIDYIKFLAPFLIFLYLEGPLASCLQALNYAKYTMSVTVITTIIKLITLFLFSLMHIGLYGLLVSEILNIFLIVYLNSKKIIKVLK